MSNETLAIVIAVSEYANETPLPACVRDGELIKDILTNTGRFSPNNTLLLLSDTTSSTVKSALAHFVQTHKGTNPAEVFFYFTGHGNFDGTDFYFLLSDYASTRPQQTALTNTELDDMLRSLTPSLTVKVVDACHSGMHYVKDPDAISKSLMTTIERYNNCYFLFSSESTQPSFQDNTLSHFTRSFARAIESHSGPSIRYKDIIDFISDDFRSNSRQKPIFVTQADFTDAFCTTSQSLIAAIRQLLPIPTAAPLSSATTTTTTTTPPPKQSLGELIIKYAQDESQRYCTKEEAVVAFEQIRSTVEAYIAPPPVSTLYAPETTFMKDSYSIPNELAIATWLKGNTQDYFVQLKYETEEYKERVRVPKYMPMLNVQVGYEFDYITRERSVLSGFDLTAAAPFRSVHVRAVPTLQNLPWWTCFLALVFSKTTIRFFYSFVKMKEINWDEREPAGKVEWLTKEAAMKEADAVKQVVGNILSDFSNAIIRSLAATYQLDVEEERS